MNLLKIFITLILNNTLICNAQLLSLEPKFIFEKFPVFNANHIHQKKIKRITFDIIDKKDWQEAEDKNLTEVYEFDTNGKLKRQYHTEIKKIIRYETHSKNDKHITTKEVYEYDTISTEYIYQPNLTIERYRFPNNYVEATYYKLCGENICKEERYIETYRTMSTGSRVLDKVLLKASDSIATFQYERQTKQVYYNNEKQPYKEKFTYYNHNNNIIKTTEQLTAANGKINKIFTYDSNNQLQRAEMIVDYGTPETYTTDFFYDDKKNLTAEKHYKDNKELKEYQYIYNENDNELKSILIRTFEAKNIRIIKLIFEYY